MTPDPFYVDQALFTLEHLSEMGIDLVCEKWLTLPQNPSLIDIDNVITSMTSRSSSKSAKKSAENESIDKASGIILKRTKSLDIYESSPSPSPDPIPSQERLSDSYEMSTAFRGGVEDKDEEDSSVWELPRGGSAGRSRSHRQYQDFGTILSMRSSLSAPSAASSLGSKRQPGWDQVGGRSALRSLRAPTQLPSRRPLPPLFPCLAAATAPRRGAPPAPAGPKLQSARGSRVQ